MEQCLCGCACRAADRCRARSRLPRRRPSTRSVTTSEPARAIEAAVDALLRRRCRRHAVRLRPRARSALARRATRVCGRPRRHHDRERHHGPAVRLGRAQLAPDVSPIRTTSLRCPASSRSSQSRCAADECRRPPEYRGRARPPGRCRRRPPRRSRVRSRPSPRRSVPVELSISPRSRGCSSTSASLRDPKDIAALGAASLPKVLPVRDEPDRRLERAREACELAVWHAETWRCTHRSPQRELDAARTRSDPSVVCHVLDLEAPVRQAGFESMVWLPLRANAGDIGALVGITQADDARRPEPARHGGRPRGARRRLPRRGVRAAARAPERGDGSAHAHSQPPRLRGAARARALRGAGAAASVEPARHRLRRLQGDQRPRRARVRRRAPPEVADVLVRALPEGAEAARLGGDEFVVMLPVRARTPPRRSAARSGRCLADGLTDAGFPLRISAGISTYPFDGAKPTALLRAGDQALYAAKAARQGSGRLVPRADRRRALVHVPEATGSLERPPRAE